MAKYKWKLLLLNEFELLLKVWIINGIRASYRFPDVKYELQLRTFRTISMASMLHWSWQLSLSGSSKDLNGKVTCSTISYSKMLLHSGPGHSGPQSSYSRDLKAFCHKRFLEGCNIKWCGLHFKKHTYYHRTNNFKIRNNFTFKIENRNKPKPSSFTNKGTELRKKKRYQILNAAWNHYKYLQNVIEIWVKQKFW